MRKQFFTVDFFYNEETELIDVYIPHVQDSTDEKRLLLFFIDNFRDSLYESLSEEDRKKPQTLEELFKAVNEARKNQ